MDNFFETVDSKNCGRILAELRKELGGMSQADLAKAFGVSRSTIMRIEYGRPPSAEFMNRLKAFQIIGLCKFKSLPEREKMRFTQLIAQANSDSEALTKTIEEFTYKSIHKRLTPFGILTGLGAASAPEAFIASRSVIVLVSAATTLLMGHGVAKGLKAILRANKLKCAEIDGGWEIIRESSERKGA
ncbi:MAG: helix-turn-helix domain-containing protein [Syntrophobacteraceae bacterium]